MICHVLLMGACLAFADEKATAKLYVSSEPFHALISVNGQATGKRTPALLEVSPGSPARQPRTARSKAASQSPITTPRGFGLPRVRGLSSYAAEGCGKLACQRFGVE